jgi:hypothetical protein
LKDGEQEISSGNPIRVVVRIDFMLPMFEAATCENKRKVFRLMGAGGHSTAVKDRGVIEESATIDRVFLRFEEIDQIRHHLNLVAFDLFQSSDGVGSFSVVGKSMITSVEPKVSIRKSR